MFEAVILTADEFEALRPADLEGRYQEQAASEMGVSRQTLGRIIKSARRQVAEFLVQGKALGIEGCTFETVSRGEFACKKLPMHLGAPSRCGEIVNPSFMPGDQFPLSPA
jgi:predicted DNA-binding protein (UPF0251 family)